MKETKILMGMPITVEIVENADNFASEEAATLKVFSYFKYVDETFSTYKPTSEITRINKGEIVASDYSEDMRTVFMLSEETKLTTNGYFDIITPKGIYDPSGLVKGWAIYNAANILTDLGFEHFYIEAGGDIEARGKNSEGKPWRVGIRNPFNIKEIVKVLYIQNRGVATSGTYIRGQHIYNPIHINKPINEIVSLTVIGPSISEADRFATGAFAMGRPGIAFIERLPGFEGYLIDKNGRATMTSGFEAYTTNHA